MVVCVSYHILSHIIYLEFIEPPLHKKRRHGTRVH